MKTFSDGFWRGMFWGGVVGLPPGVAALIWFSPTLSLGMYVLILAVVTAFGLMLLWVGLSPPDQSEGG